MSLVGGVMRQRGVEQVIHGEIILGGALAGLRVDVTARAGTLEVRKEHWQPCVVQLHDLVVERVIGDTEESKRLAELIEFVWQLGQLVVVKI
eukprot:CAMPEP_0174706694 /NCGR_PEP_ID=MMETSP1094-20130205/9449_1 /TAXON_ID=156173 /ORGANISM="Chrysochromulina brevifilum, Strain UTEX LB 985" /LENGTH=91 /DNA_ID=CAMNT_0015904993 /DNA_START=645 /DNA_END=920 /DNA_ORIENTATION=+